MSIQVLQEVKNRFAILNSSQALALDQINDALMWGARDYFRQQGFTWIDVPTITKITGACENVDTLYALDHFGEEAYLAQTGQLYLETKIPGHKKVWTIIQSNRAEARADARHLNQFQLVEFEEEGDFEQLLTRIEGTVKAMMEATLEQKEAYALLERNPKEVEAWVKEPFGRITYTEAIEMLKGTPLEVAWGADLGHEEEQFLVKAMGWKPCFITNFPTAIKFFNMRQVPGKDEIVNSADLLLPYAGESVGSAERENDHDKLVARLQDSQMFKVLSSRGKTLDDFKEYLDFIKENPVLHSGCGIGFARVAQSVLGLPDIRMATAYPLTSETLY
jgi:asparaginyl-tRNA synthetase